MNILGKIWNRLNDYFVPSEKNSYRPHSLRRDFLVFIVAFVCVVEGFLATSLMLEQNISRFSAAVLEGALVSLTNTARAHEHKGALVQNPALTLSAQAKANDMAQRGYFSHSGPEGKQPWDWMKEAGYDYAYAGENLAAHFYNSSDVVDAWLDSPSHRANMLRSSYTETGIGIAHGTYQGVDTIFVVQFFGVSKQALGIKAVQGASVASVAKDESKQTEVASRETVKSAVPLEESALPIVAGKSISEIPNRIDRLLSSPRDIAMWMLSSLLLLIFVSILLAFFIRIRIQPVDLLINGMVVAAFVLSILASNTYFFSRVDLTGSEAASISAFAE